MDIRIKVLNPTFPEPKEGTVTKDDVFGKWSDDRRTRIHDGMVVANGKPDDPPTCPIWGDKVPYKSVTVVFAEALEGEVSYLLEYVLGGGAIGGRRVLGDGKIALRANYMAW